jgi:(R,R)-butanediol dehydrogenase/meso-butanediol dehydrogenase/diacetyl reductase
MKMMPGMPKELRNQEIDDRELSKIEGIIHSMTLAERRDPKIIDGSRKLRISRGAGVDVVAECSGTTRGLTPAMNGVRTRGSIVQTGLHTKPATIDAMQLSEKDISYIGSWCYLITDWPRIIRLIASGKYPVAKAVTARIDLEDVVPQGFDVLVDPTGDQLKVLVSPTGTAASS